MKERLIEIGRDSAWYLVSSIAVTVTGFVAIPILTRILPPRQYGIFSQDIAQQAPLIGRGIDHVEEPHDE